MAGAQESGAGPPVSVVRATWAAIAVVLIGFGALSSEGSPAGLVRHGPFTSDFFDEQAAALLDGRLDVDPDVVGLEGFVHDGRTHLYFGLAPALVRLPVVALTDRFDGRLTQLSMLLALTVICWAAARLAWRARSVRSGGPPVDGWEPWVVAGFTASVGLASPLLFLASRPIVYHEAAIWGVAGALLTAEGLLRWWERPRWTSLVAVGASATLAISSRGSLGFGAVAAVLLVGALAVLTRRVGLRAAAGVITAAAIPLGAYVAVNQARFDEPLRVPYDRQVIASYDPVRQAVLDATDGTLFGGEFVPTTVMAYLRPDGLALQPLFPWLAPREPQVIGDVRFDTLDATMSLPTAAPVLVLLSVAAIPWALRRAGREPWFLVGAGLAVGVAPTLAIAYIAHRYLADLVPVVVVGAAPGLWLAVEWVGRRRRRRASLAVAASLSVLATAGLVASALEYQRLVFLPELDVRRGFVGLQYDLYERISGGRPPHVEVRDDEPGARRPQGTVTIVGGCEALYWSDGREHWPLELGGERGVLLEAPQRGSVAVQGPDWRVEWVVDGGRARLEHVGGERRVGPWVDRDALRTPIVLWRDVVNHEVVVRAGDDVLLRAWLVPLGGPVRGPDGERLDPAETPLCEQLRERLRAR